MGKTRFMALAGTVCFAAWLAGGAAAVDFAVVPGQRIGSVRLGMTMGSVNRALGAPSRTRRLPHGLALETWLSHAPAPQWEFDDKSLKHNSLAVFFRQGRAVQIEASAPRFAASGGLTTRSPAAAWKRRYHPYRSWEYMWIATDPDVSSPAAKHYLEYSDAVTQGIAWKCGAWGDLAPEPGDVPETVIVHLPGQRALLNPNDADDYAGTGHRHQPPYAR